MSILTILEVKRVARWGFTAAPLGIHFLDIGETPESLPIDECVCVCVKRIYSRADKWVGICLNLLISLASLSFHLPAVC